MEDSEYKAKNKELSRLLPRLIFGIIIAVLSFGFGINSIIDAIQKILDISDKETGGKKFGASIVSILYFLEAGLFIFFIGFSTQKSIVLHRRRSKIKEETGIKAENDQKKLENKQKKLAQKQQKNKKKLEKKEKKNSKKTLDLDDD